MPAASRQVDTNVKIPAAVRAAAEAADAAHKAVYDPAAPPAEPPPAPVVPPAAADPEPPPAPPVTPEGKPPATEQSWENRYNAMKGRFDRADASVKELSATVTSLQNVIASMSAPPAAPPATPPAPGTRPITPEEVTEYGAEFLDVVGRKAQEIAGEQVRKLEGRIEQLQATLASVNGSVTASAQERMFAAMDSAVPNWRDLNEDEKFISWLRLPDAYSGAIRHELLKAAFGRNDSNRVIAFFKGFLSEEAAVDPATRERTPEVPGTPPATPKVPLASLAAPGRAKTPAGGTPPVEKPVISRAQITQFYADVAAGKYRGRDDEKKSLEGQIFDAQRDGRISG